MARHLKAADTRVRLTRAVAITVLWLAGIAAGFFGILGAAARYGCARNATGLACRSSGSALGIVIVLGVVSVVSVVTVFTHDREPRVIVVRTALGLVALGALYLASHALISTV